MTVYGIGSACIWKKAQRDFYIERRGRGSKGRPAKKFKAEIEEDLLAEVQRLRAENAYLEKLNALVAERVKKKKKQK